MLKRPECREMSNLHSCEKSLKILLVCIFSSFLFSRSGPSNVNHSNSAKSFLYPLNLISDESMQLLVQAILSVSGESKKPDLQDCLLLQNSPARNLSGSQSEPHTSYMVEYSQMYQTDESYSQAVPQIQKSKCCPG